MSTAKQLSKKRETKSMELIEGNKCSTAIPTHIRNTHKRSNRSSQSEHQNTEKTDPHESGEQTHKMKFRGQKERVEERRTHREQGPGKSKTWKLRWKEEIYKQSIEEETAEGKDIQRATTKHKRRTNQQNNSCAAVHLAVI